MHPSRGQFTTLAAGSLAGLTLAPLSGLSAGAAPAPNVPRRRGLDERAVQAALDALVTDPVIGAVASVVGPVGAFATASSTRWRSSLTRCPSTLAPATRKISRASGRSSRTLRGLISLASQVQRAR